MMYSVYYCQKTALEWGITDREAVLFNLLYSCGSWTTQISKNEKIYNWISKTKIIEELPLSYSKTNTVQKAIKRLAEKGVIDWVKDGKKDLIRITEKGRNWNRKSEEKNPSSTPKSEEKNPNEEKNPQERGNISSKSEEKNPTYKITNKIRLLNNNNCEKEKGKKVNSSEDSKIIELFFSEFWNKYPKQVGKANCLKKYHTLLKNKSTREKRHSEIMKGLEGYKASKEEWCAWKNPMTFLNGNCWEDYLTPDNKTKTIVTAQNWKQRAQQLNKTYVPGGWLAEPGEENSEWAKRVISWLKIGLDRYWIVEKQDWDYSKKQQLINTMKKAKEEAAA